MSTELKPLVSLGRPRSFRPDAVATGGGRAERMVEVETLSLWYGKSQALNGISLSAIKNSVTALIGPSGCGKSTLLRCLNRMNDLAENIRIQGVIRVNNRDIYDPSQDVDALRKRIGMVFQRSTPFPKSIYENIVFGPRILGVKRRAELDEIVESSLAGAALW